MSDRYSRQVKVLGADAQATLTQKTVLIIGVGALGSINAELLCRSGVGKLILVDDDVVELSNLQRQALYTEEDVGEEKVTALKSHLNKINKEVKVETRKERLSKETELPAYDVILDCTDNLESRFFLNEYALEQKKPCVFCMVVREKGMLYVVEPSTNRACFRCVFDKLESIGNSDELGILNTTTYLAGTLQAAEVMKLLLGEPCVKGLVNFDASAPQLDSYLVKKRKDCPACGR
ncbi:HesA/MoeB/ThiF family protein [Candidatus Woesearchaeota archaeon]|nr:HesA/MoeB/ThiF family protein [Candidatus Woesearchaeota archaeon]